MEIVDKLVEIWQGIPKAATEQLDLSQKEIINQHMDMFNIGEGFYVIFNTQTAEMEYISPKLTEILGYELQEFNLKLLLENLHPEDIPYYYHYEQSAVRFFSGLSSELFFSYKFSYDYRVRTKDGDYKRVLQQVIPIYYFPKGGARTLGIFTDITHLNVQGIPKLSFIGMKGKPSFYNVHLRDEFSLSEKLFTKREKEILAHVLKGKNSRQISEELNLSIYTIQTHRKNILKKSGCSNLTELLTKSVREGWV